jgi:N-acetyl-gamma-glutamyl-phosphate reductase common form
MSKQRVGIVGARGYVARELMALMARHDGFELAFVGSRELAGTRVRDVMPEANTELSFSALSAQEVAESGVDLLVLALPNNVSRAYVEAVDQAAPGMAVLDLSADWRFDAGWVYGWPERLRGAIRGAKRVSNPGCYATGMQTALWPLTELLRGPATVFGVSGYSGAGTEPSPKNDVEQLRDNLMPYKLVGHVHEREVTFQLNHPIHFMPHVAPFFRGITLTIACDLNTELEARHVYDRWAEVYAGEPLVQITRDIPLVRAAANQHHVTIGGVEIEAQTPRMVCVATLDNLLKGAATQALQNMNLMAGFEEFEAIL